METDESVHASILQKILALYCSDVDLLRLVVVLIAMNLVEGDLTRIERLRIDHGHRSSDRGTFYHLFSTKTLFVVQTLLFVANQDRVPIGVESESNPSMRLPVGWSESPVSFYIMSTDTRLILPASQDSRWDPKPQR